MEFLKNLGRVMGDHLGIPADHEDGSLYDKENLPKNPEIDTQTLQKTETKREGKFFQLLVSGTHNTVSFVTGSILLILSRLENDLQRLFGNFMYEILLQKVLSLVENLFAPGNSPSNSKGAKSKEKQSQKGNEKETQNRCRLVKILLLATAKGLDAFLSRYPGGKNISLLIWSLMKLL